MSRNERPQTTARAGKKPSALEVNSLTPSRRSFFRNVAVGAGASAIAAVTGGPVAAATTGAGTDPAGYRETEHVKKVYAAARF